MDSNHDIVPTLRMMDGVYTGLAADEIERLRARVVALERRSNTALIPGAEPTHRCKVCGAYWRKWNVDGESSWNLNSRGCGECCDNALMGDQIEPLSSPAKVGGDERELFTTWLETRSIAGEMLTASVHPFEAFKGGMQTRAALSADGGDELRLYRWLKDSGRTLLVESSVLCGLRYAVSGFSAPANWHANADDAIRAAIAANQSGKGGE